MNDNYEHGVFSKHIEALYIERRLLSCQNYKKLKITEDDLTLFEDEQVTLNAANLFLE
jgi:hypothetical protein